MKTVINSKANKRNRNTSPSGNSSGSGNGHGRQDNGTDGWTDKQTNVTRGTYPARSSVWGDVGIAGGC